MAHRALPPRFRRSPGSRTGCRYSVGAVTPTKVAAQTLEEVVLRINAVHGTTLSLTGRFGAGEQGAYRLRDAAGAQFVLKWSPGERGVGRLPAVVPTLDCLRERGYPIPRYTVFGVLRAPQGRYSVQELLPGESVWDAAQSVVDDALALNALQAGRAAHLALGRRYRGVAYPPWCKLLPRLARRGGNGFCHLRAMRAYSPEAARLLATIQAFIADHADRLAAVPATDVVHFDFGGHNILVHEGRITGVVDWEGLVPGDRAFDLATFLFYDGYYARVAPTRERLWSHALELVDAATLGVYLCHMAHREADWSIRHHGPATVAEVLDVCDAVLTDVARRSGYPVRAWR